MKEILEIKILKCNEPNFMNGCVYKKENIAIEWFNGKYILDEDRKYVIGYISNARWDGDTVVCDGIIDKKNKRLATEEEVNGVKFGSYLPPVSHSKGIT